MYLSQFVRKVVISILVIGFFATVMALTPIIKRINESISDITASTIQEENIEESISEPIPILFTGDLMLGRYVETLINQKGSEYLFGEGVDEVFSSHITIANLEGPIPEKHKRTPINGFQFSFPTTTVKILKKHSIETVSLANNHSLDHGMSGLVHTKKVLDAEGISHFGAYHTTTDGYFMTTIGTTTVIVYGINMISSSWDEKEAIRVTSELRRNHSNAVLIAFIHWGSEYIHMQGDNERKFAHALVDKGVNVIVGSHPHVVQGIELYKNTPIFYSLGNFIFDQYFSEETQQGYFLSFTIKDKKMSFTIIPTVSSRSKVSLATSTRKENILKTIFNNSSLDVALYRKGMTITLP